MHNSAFNKFNNKKGEEKVKWQKVKKRRRWISRQDASTRGGRW